MNEPLQENTESKVISCVEDLLTVQELAERLKTRASWVYSRTRERGPNSIPVVRVGKYLRFSLLEVLDWLRRVNG